MFKLGLNLKINFHSFQKTFRHATQADHQLEKRTWRYKLWKNSFANNFFLLPDRLERSSGILNCFSVFCILISTVYELHSGASSEKTLLRRRPWFYLLLFSLSAKLKVRTCCSEDGIFVIFSSLSKVLLRLYFSRRFHFESETVIKPGMENIFYLEINPPDFRLPFTFVLCKRSLALLLQNGISSSPILFRLNFFLAIRTRKAARRKGMKKIVSFVVWD